MPGTDRVDSFTCEHAFLSNFYEVLVSYEGITYPSVEHAFQAQKTLDEAERRKIATCGSPGRAKGLGRKVRLRKDWESVKVDLMTQLVRIKFMADADLRERLLRTGDAELIEGNSWNDRFWGVSGGQGKNWLGRILMQVRDELRAEDA
jgi:N-glycosidase YbiA